MYIFYLSRFLMKTSIFVIGITIIIVIIII
jgi:hypothetical protein